jgi:hypothetical protein
MIIRLSSVILAFLLVAGSSPASSTGSHRSSSHRSSSHSSNKPVHVRSYTRKNGTVVGAYNRSYPGQASRTHNTSSATTSRSTSHTTNYSSAHTYASGVRNSHPGQVSSSRSSATTTHSASHPANYSGTHSYASGARDGNGRLERSQAARDSFKRQQPCPATGKPSGPCPGYVIDHVKPLACGGGDAPSNMQWQTIAEGKAKDQWERKGCK